MRTMFSYVYSSHVPRNNRVKINKCKPTDIIVMRDRAGRADDFKYFENISWKFYKHDLFLRFW